MRKLKNILFFHLFYFPHTIYYFSFYIIIEQKGQILNTCPLNYHKTYLIVLYFYFLLLKNLSSPYITVIYHNIIYTFYHCHMGSFFHPFCNNFHICGNNVHFFIFCINQLSKNLSKYNL